MAPDPLIHTALPAKVQHHIGEYELGQVLKNFSGSSLEFWFDVNFLPEAPDIDLIAYSPKVGIFVCEVKAYTISQIKTYNTNTFINSSGESRQHPVEQAANAAIALRNFQNGMHRAAGESARSAFFQIAVIWPRITRAEWEARFKGAALRQASGFIFKDDLQSARHFIDRLSQVSAHPSRGKPAPYDVRGKHAGVAEFRDMMATELKAYKSSNKVQADNFDEVDAAIREASKYPYGTTHNVFLEGAAGTGKTTLLLNIGLQHARAGARVLYLCYNRALAAAVRHAYQQQRIDSEMLGSMTVLDQYAFYEKIEPALAQVGYERGDDVIRCIKAMPADERPEYDTVLIDESQDISGDVFRIIEHVSTTERSMFVAYSKGQELYGAGEREWPSAELKAWKATATKRVRNRLFRGSSLPFLAAYMAQQFAPDFHAARKFIEDKVLTKRFNVGEDRTVEALPEEPKELTLHYLPTVGDDFEQAVRSAVLDAVQEVRNAGGDSNLLIVCFGQKSPTYPTVKEALREARVKVHDLFEEKNRSTLAPLGAVRIARALGCRGLTATHVLVFDYDFLETWHNNAAGSPPIGNMAYVVLSRAHVATRVYVAADKINDTVRFLDKALAELRLLEVTGQR